MRQIHLPSSSCCLSTNEQRPLLLRVVILFLLLPFIAYRDYNKSLIQLENVSEQIDDPSTISPTSEDEKKDNNNVVKRGNRLEYVHITKTGGSTIEYEASMQQNITWGACHWVKMKNNGPGCQQPDTRYSKEYNEANIPFVIYIRPLQNVGEPWHTPPHWFQSVPFEFDDTFTIVRDPYTRMISQFYCKYRGYPRTGGKGFERRINNATILNEWIQNLLSKMPIKKAHFLPQHHYVYDKHGNRMIDHVIKLENLNDEFARLMNEYDIDVRLPETKINSRKADSALTVDDLDDKSIKLINRAYHDDFDRFNYKMIQ